jgi:hypothetical protein
MDRRQQLLSLAYRCEHATGPDRELDGAIHSALPSPLGVDRAKAMAAVGVYGPEYTASLDAAMTLVPEGTLFNAGHSGDDKPGRFNAVVMPAKGKTQYAEASLAALALCAAALRAQAATVPAEMETA